MIRVIIVDDHQMFIDGIKSLLADESSIEVIGEALSGEALLQMLETQPVDVVIMDINMPGMNGTETTRALTTAHPIIKVLMLTMYNEQQHIAGALQAGATGYILKNTGKAELIEAITRVYEGNYHYDNKVTETIMQNLHQPHKDTSYTATPLTKREREVLQCIAQEYTTPEIAEKLFISTHTVESHRKNLLSKLNVRNTAGLVRYALEHNLVE